MRLKSKPRRAAKAVTIRLNRSAKLESRDGFYDGRHIHTRYVRLPEIKAPKVMAS